MILARNDTDIANWNINDFEGTASFIMPHDPVINKKVSNDGYTLSEIDTKQDNDHGDDTKKQGTKINIREGIGKTGVALRFHTKSGYAQLNQDQKRELYEFRNPNGDTRDSASQKTPKFDRFNKKIEGIISEVLASD